MLIRTAAIIKTALVSTLTFCYASASRNQSTLVDGLVKQGILKSPDVISVMKSVDRGDYSPASEAYYDHPQPIGYQATISAPHMHAFAMEFLKDHLRNGKKALDVGSGSGYLTVCFAKLMKSPDAVSYGVEHIGELVEKSLKNIKESPDKDLLESGRVVIFEGDGRLGLKKYAPYDAIHVGAGATEIPKELLNQLANGGRMLIPVGKYNQEFLVIDKDEKGEISKKSVLDVRYVPLTDKKSQLSNFF